MTEPYVDTAVLRHPLGRLDSLGRHCAAGCKDGTIPCLRQLYVSCAYHRSEDGCYEHHLSMAMCN